MDREDAFKAMRRRQLAEDMEGNFRATLDDRISRYQELEFIKLTPNTHFAAVSVECINLLRDGYFFACIALSQSVAEAIVRFMCQRNKFRPVSQDYMQSVSLLRRRRIQPDCTELFEEIWEHRDDYHHLNPTVPGEQSKLRDIAKSKMVALHKVESEVFGFVLVGGAVSPNYTKYWDYDAEGRLPVYLRFDT